MSLRTILLTIAMAAAGTLGAAAQDMQPGMQSGATQNDTDMVRGMMQRGGGMMGQEVDPDSTASPRAGTAQDGSTASDEGSETQGAGMMDEQMGGGMMHGHMGSGMMDRHTGGGMTTGYGMMQGGRTDCGAGSRMTRDGMGFGMMGRHMGGGGMMGSGMMGSRMMGSGMMGTGMMGGARSGRSALFGLRVRPVMNLSVDDVRSYLALRLKRLGNKRLKLGDTKATDDDTITADIVTVDNSLVEQLKVDRHTGAITYQD